MSKLARSHRASVEYWRKRETEAIRNRLKDETKYFDEITRIYNRAHTSIDKEINAFYGRYASKEGISIADAKKRADSLDIKVYAAKAKQYVKAKDFSDRANEELRLYNLTMKVSRLELLKANIGLELVSAYQDLDNLTYSALSDRTREEFKRQSGILGESINDSKAAVEDIINQSFHNATFSERIWRDQSILKNKIDSLISTALIQGRNPKILAGELRKAMGVSRYNSERLMVTELARVQTEAQKNAYSQSGYDEYQYITIGAGACPVCQRINGRTFKVRDMMIGENAPPLHPQCRCSTAASVGSVDEIVDELLERAHEYEMAITSDLKMAVSKGSGHLVGLEYRFKSKESLKRKILSKSKARNISVQEYSKKIADVLRYTNVSSEKYFTNDFYTIVANLENKGYNLVELTNTFIKNAPYKGINSLVENSDGYVFELQFHTPKSLEVKEVNHKLYEEVRKDGVSDKRKIELTNTMMKNSNEIVNPKGVSDIRNIERDEMYNYFLAYENDMIIRTTRNHIPERYDKTVLSWVDDAELLQIYFGGIPVRVISEEEAMRYCVS